MSAKSDIRLIESLESHAATINRHLDVLSVALANTRDRALRRKISSEIDYYTRELARVHRDRDAAARRIARKSEE